MKKLHTVLLLLGVAIPAFTAADSAGDNGATRVRVESPVPVELASAIEGGTRSAYTYAMRNGRLEVAK